MNTACKIGLAMHVHAVRQHKHRNKRGACEKEKTDNGMSNRRAIMAPDNPHMSFVVCVYFRRSEWGEGGPVGVVVVCLCLCYAALPLFPRGYVCSVTVLQV